MQKVGNHGHLIRECKDGLRLTADDIPCVQFAALLSIW